MKKSFLGLAAILIALGGSAFTFASAHKAVNFAAITYYQYTPNGDYTRIPPGGSCTDDTSPCTLVFPNPGNVDEEETPETFDSSSVPTDLGTPQAQGGNGYYH